MHHIKFLHPLFAFLLFSFASVFAEDRVIVVSSADQDHNLDLAVVAEVFKESRSLQEFERTLNDPDEHINNLDLNDDGQVDYIRVIEEEKVGSRVVILQAILGDNMFTDVAYIDITGENGNYRMQIRGERELYGDNYYYIPESRNLSTWNIFVDYYGHWDSCYVSPYYWGYYPSWWSPYTSLRIGLYRTWITRNHRYRHFSFSINPCITYYHRNYHRNHRFHDWGYRDRGRDRHRHYDSGRRDHDRHRDWDHDRRRDHDRWRDHDGRRGYEKGRKPAERENEKKREPLPTKIPEKVRKPIIEYDDYWKNEKHKLRDRYQPPKKEPRPEPVIRDPRPPKIDYRPPEKVKRPVIINRKPEPVSRPSRSLPKIEPIRTPKPGISHRSEPRIPTRVREASIPKVTHRPSPPKQVVRSESRRPPQREPNDR